MVVRIDAFSGRQSYFTLRLQWELAAQTSRQGMTNQSAGRIEAPIM